MYFSGGSDGLLKMEAWRVQWRNNKMLNILKVAGFFQSVPSFNSLQEKASQEPIESAQTNMMPDFFGGRSSNNQKPRKEDVEKGAS